MLNLGTVRPGSTVRIPFSTFDKDDGSSITMSSYAAADILVYKDGSTTERGSTAGFTATTDFDAKTGKHLAVLDLADNTTAGFWTAGSEYLVAIDAVTVDGVNTGAWIARFVIGYQGANLDTTIASLSSQTSFTLAAGPAEDDALNGHWAIIHDVASAVQRATVLISDYVGSTRTVTLAAGATFTVAAGDNISVMDLAPLQPATHGRTLAVSAAGAADANVTQYGGSNGTFASGRPEVNATHIGGSAISQSGGVANVNVTQISGDAAAADNAEAAFDGTGYNVGAGSIVAASVATDGITSGSLAASAISEIQSGLATAAALATVAGYLDTEIADILADTNELQTKLVPLVEQVSDGYRFTAFALEEAPTGGSAPTAGEIADAVWDEALSGHLAGGSAGAALSAAEDGAELLDQLTEVVSDGPRFTSFALEQVQAEVADALAAYDPPTHAELLARTLPSADYATAAALQAVDDYVDTEVAAIKAKTDNLPSDPADASDIAASFSAVNATLATIAGYIDTEVAAILADTDELQAKLVPLVEQVSDGYRFTAFALEEAPTGGSAPTAAQIADAVWDEALAGHLAGGSAGAALTDASVGAALLEQLTEEVSDGPRFTSFALEQVQAEVADALAAYDPPTHAELLARTLPSADYATAAALQVVDDYVDTEIAAIKAKTDNLPSDPADASDIAASFGAVNATLSTIAGYIDTEVAAILADTDELQTKLVPLVEQVSDGYRFTAQALEEAPTDGSAPTAAQIADAVWDEALAGHLAGGSAGAALSAADDGAALLDQLTEVVSDGPRFTSFAIEQVQAEVADALAAYDPPTHAELLARTLPSADYATAAALQVVDDYVDTEVAAIKAKTDNLPADPADASDIAASFGAVNATLSTIAGYIDTEVAAIKAKTDNLPADPADASDIAASFATVNATLSTIAGYVDTEVAAIKATTDKVELLIEQVSDGYRFRALALEESADAILRAPLTEGYAADGAAMTAEQALHMIWSLLAERAVSGATLTARKLDGVSTAMEFTLNSATTPTEQTRSL